MFCEEAGGGASGGSVYELIDPMHTTGVSLDRATGAFSGGVGAANLVRRDSLGKASFEGHGLLSNGVMYFGDENRPASGVGGGAYFKFIPSTPWVSGTVSSLSQSPLASGRLVGLRVGVRSGGTDYGQGSQTGLAKWIPLCDDATATTCANFDLRGAAATNKLTGHYRPEDLEVDRTAMAAGNVKVCGPNTGNEAADHNWGEVICITDGTVATSLANSATPEVQNFILGTSEQAMMDNIAFRPGKGTWVLHEDGDIGDTLKNNDLWSCLADGADVDSLSDGCLRIATLNDTSSAAHPEGAEWSGGMFDATGTRFFVSVQHNITGHGVILEVTGWK
jgi:secreted PhoX family phosphatase